MSQVAARTTPCTPADLIAELSEAYRLQMGHTADPRMLAVLAAQVALETGGMRSLVCWNIGNIKRGPGPDWCSFQTFEYVGDPPVRTTMVCDFSAWPSLTDACVFFLSFLSQHYPEAWSSAVAGDVPAFAHGLRQRGYYTAPEASYAAGVARWRDYYLALLGGDPAPTEPEIASLGALATEAIDGIDVRADYVPSE